MSAQFIINTVTNTSVDPATWWNSAMSTADHVKLESMANSAGGINNLRGRRVKCAGASGLGSYGAVITRVDVGKGWIEVLWDDGDYTAWKTAKLCNLE